MTIDKEHLKALAEAATKAVGPYRVETDYNGVHQVIGDGSWKILNAWHTPDGKGRQNAEFFAAANPATVLALLDKIEQSGLRIAAEQDRVISVIGQYAHIEGERDRLKAENETLQERLDLLGDENTALLDRIERVEAESGSLRKDAARWKWLEGSADPATWESIGCQAEMNRHLHVDAAMVKETGQ